VDIHVFDSVGVAIILKASEPVYPFDSRQIGELILGMLIA
jgi:hypothetical protein